MDLNFPKLEKEILDFWKKDRTFEKSVMRRKNAPNFVFYEGPPTANGKPGIHHVLSRVFKDIICRYKTMRGFKVIRKAGWDTHGLPVELEIEKKLGLKSKKDIEKFGIAEFNKLCKESVWNYKKDWEDLTERIAFWLDLKNPYITYETNYIETVWWIIKEIWKKGLVYKGYKVVPYCPRCGTSLSSHEVAQGYERVKEPAVYIKFKITDAKFKNSYLLVWTTTPWTLPGNVAVAVNPEIVYVVAEVNNEKLILAKERLSVLGESYKTIKELKGKELLNLEYEPLYKFSKPDKKAWFVIPGDFVSTEEGTGLVHIAPAFGEEDMAAGRENNLPVLLTVDEEGKMKPEIKDWAGLFVKEADPLIIEDLEKRNLLFKEEMYEHDYPFCWRCKSPLLYYAKQSWFINMQGVKEDLIGENKKINWVPAHLKEGRFGEWLEDLKDWAFSRERYWGTPLPIWQCKKCGNLEVIGSKKELLEQKFSNNNYFVLRHGESQTQIKKITACWPEKEIFPLTENGRKETLSAAKALKNKKIDLIFSSDIARTKQTAEIVAKETGAKLIFDERIREFNVGIFNGGKPIEVWDFLKSKDDLLSTKLPEGESLLDVQKRMLSFLNDLNEKYQNRNILIVSHELPLTVLENSLTGKSLKEILEQRQWEKEKRIKTGEFRKLEFKSLPYNDEGEFDFHRPYIDEVKFYCKKCQNLMERTTEVIDCWFDSGSMPFAQAHWPFVQTQNLKIKNQKVQPPELFPADYISEAIDQTRGWFYTLLAISTLLGFGVSYKNVISLGHVLDEKGEKMSKSKGNIVDPWYIVDKYGADTTRWYFYTVNQPGDSKLFSEKDIDLTLKKFILTLWNSFIFFETYGINSKFKIKNSKLKSKNILDKWILSKLNNLIEETTKELDSYDVTGAARAVETFVIEDLSQWYIRRSRKRFHKPETKKELTEASETLGFVLLSLSKIMAPFIPFLSEEINKKLGGGESVHLADWPKTEKKLIDDKLEEKMKRVREIVSLGLEKRAQLGIKVRQPLNEIAVGNLADGLEEEFKDLVKDELNVKGFRYEVAIKDEIKLDENITAELKEEGIVREIIRNIQEMRKKAGLKPEDKILVKYSGDADLNKVLAREKNKILGEARVKDLILGEKEKEVFDAEREIKVDNKNLWLAIKKI